MQKMQSDWLLKITDSNHAEEAIQSLFNFYRPEFMPFIKQLVPKIKDISSHYTIQSTLGNYRPEYSPFMDQFIPKISARDAKDTISLLIRDYRP